MNEKIKKLVELQNTLNNMTNGNKWTTGVTNKGKTINWFTAMTLECSEAIDSTPWKHWKAIKGETDLENLQVEVVDVFHFLMSQLIVIYGVEKTSDILFTFLDKSKIKKNLDFVSFNRVTKEFMLISLSLELIDQFTYTELIESFVNMMNESLLSFEELYNLYIMKNALNMIRQNNGYKEGTYVKIWNGQEDNVYLHGLISENPDMSFEEIMERLQSEYDSISK